MPIGQLTALVIVLYAVDGWTANVWKKFSPRLIRAWNFAVGITASKGFFFRQRNEQVDKNVLAFANYKLQNQRVALWFAITKMERKLDEPRVSRNKEEGVWRTMEGEKHRSCFTWFYYSLPESPTRNFLSLLSLRSIIAWCPCIIK